MTIYVSTGWDEKRFSNQYSGFGNHEIAKVGDLAYCCSSALKVLTGDTELHIFVGSSTAGDFDESKAIAVAKIATGDEIASTSVPTGDVVLSPSADAKVTARTALPQLSDLPAGFRDQGSNVDVGTSPGILAIGSNSFSRSLSTAEGLQGLAVTVGGIVLVCEDEETAIRRASADNLKTSITATALAAYSVFSPDVAVISFTDLSDGTAAVELSGSGIVGGQTANIGLRAVSIRSGRIVVTIQTTSLGLGSISELEDIATSVSTRLADVE
jgi:hypothetical protein